MASSNCSKERRLRNDHGLSLDSESDTETGTSAFWPSWLIMEGTDNSRPLSKEKGLDPWMINRGIKGICGQPKSVKNLKSDALLIECATKKQSDQLLKAVCLVDRPIKVTPHRSLNSSKGVIRCKELRSSTKEKN